MSRHLCGVFYGHTIESLGFVSRGFIECAKQHVTGDVREDWSSKYACERAATPNPSTGCGTGLCAAHASPICACSICSDTSNLNGSKCGVLRDLCIYTF